MKIIAMITARSTSSRFPRKHIAPLGNKPMICRIIDNIRLLKGIDKVVLATTTNKTDDDLVEIVKWYGASVIRGSENDLTERHGRVLLKYKPDAVLNISGDCPFMDINAMQAVVDAVKDHPLYDGYNISGPYARVPEMLAGIHSTTWYIKAFEIYKRHPKSCSADQYWLATIEEPNCMSTYTVDGSAFLNKTVTPMKLSIDWDLEREFFNIIIDYLGHYPTHLSDFEIAFKGLEGKNFIGGKNE